MLGERKACCPVANAFLRRLDLDFGFFVDKLAPASLHL